MKGISLEEYNNQEIPKRGNKVLLKPDEYNIHFSFKYQKGIETMISVKGYEGYEYSLMGKKGFLYTVDQDGNRGAASVFYIGKLKEEPRPFNGIKSKI